VAGWEVNKRGKAAHHVAVDSQVQVVDLNLKLMRLQQTRTTKTACRVVSMLHVAIWVGIELVAKWTLIRQRLVGTYNYDTASYGQGWELLVAVLLLLPFVLRNAGSSKKSLSGQLHLFIHGRYYSI
jgi:hypothetical protein